MVEPGLEPPLKFLADGEIKIICERLADSKPNEGYDRAWEYWCLHVGVKARYRAPDSINIQNPRFISILLSIGGGVYRRLLSSISLLAKLECQFGKG